MAVPIIQPARVNLLTAPSKSSSKYHLMELNADLVKLFEQKSSSSSQERGTKRTREEDDDDDNNEKLPKSTLCIKGRQSDEAVLCTDTQTFMIREVTQSNSLLLCSLDEKSTSDSNSNSAHITVRDSIVEILELVPIVPRTSRISSLLEQSAYNGEEEEEELKNGTKKFYSPQQVASIVQASPAELRKGFIDCHVIEMNGYSRMISHNYLFESLRTLLAHVDRLALSPDRILLRPAIAALRDMQNMRVEVAQAMLQSWFGHPTEEEDVISLEIKTMSRFVGLELLQTIASDKPIEVDSFKQQWKDALGATLGSSEGTLDMNLLQGNYLLTPAPPAIPNNFNPLSVQFFSANVLPLEISARFQKLFSIRAQWTGEELKPFLRDVAVDSKKHDALLLKFARSSQASMPIFESKQERRARLKAGKPHAPTKTITLYSARLRY